MIDPAFFDRLKKTSFRGTIVQHHEYPLGRGPELYGSLPISQSPDTIRQANSHLSVGYLTEVQ